MDYAHIEVERRGRVGIVRMGRPQFRNAQSRRMLQEMDHAFLAAERDDDIRVIVLAGAGDHFSAGHDLGTREELADRAENPVSETVMARMNRSWELYVESSLRWRDLRKPTLAQVQGYCILGGYLVAACMDVIVAADDAKFLPGHLQVHTAPWDLGVREAKRILFENSFVSAQEARRIGLVSEVAPRAELEAATMAQAERWAKNDLLTLRLLKQSVNGAQDAMGYRNAVQAAHSTYMLMEMTVAERYADKTPQGRHSGVSAALAKDET